jgi:hypothetical protein
MPRYYVFQTVIHTTTGTHVTDVEVDRNGHKTYIDTGVEEDYKVSECADGHWECSCKAWIFGRAHMHDGVRLSDSEIEHLIRTQPLDSQGREWHPNGRCKHAMWVIGQRPRFNAAVASGATVRIESNGFYAEVENGRILSFFAHLPTPAVSSARSRR